MSEPSDGARSAEQAAAARSSAEATPTAQTYFEAIELTFISLRGAPFLLTSADWELTRQWYDQGIPLALVEQALTDFFTRRKARKKDSKLWSLRQCKRAVEAAWKARLDLEAPTKSGDVPSFDVAGRLQKLARALPPALVAGASFEERIHALSGDPEDVERELAKLDEELLDHVEKGMSLLERDDLEAALREALGALAKRLSADELASAERKLRQQLLRQRMTLPILSLFAPEAHLDDRDVL